MKLMAGIAMPRSFRAEAGNPLWNHYRCADDQWLALAMLQPDRYWADLCRAIERPELAEDPRFAEMGARTENRAECIAMLDETFGRYPRADWIQRLNDDPGDFIFTIVNTVDDLPDDPQVQANDYVVTMDHPQHGPTKMVGVPVRLSETPGSVRRAAPELGQDTEMILMDVLGWDWEKIETLREKEAI
jgi:crotonobetainyl-CoA:carnitine CoA-transferase CaiB-like acyl-CoA transferase